MPKMGKSNMKGGIVVSLRINPQDVMSCIDIVDMSNLPLPPGTSISQVIKIAFEGLIEHYRKNLPQHDGFEFDQMVSRFSGVRQGRKLSVTDTLEGIQANRISLDQPHSLITKMPSGDSPGTDAGTPNNPNFDKLVREKARLLIKVRELSFRQDNDADNFTEADAEDLNAARSELQRINEELRK